MPKNINLNPALAGYYGGHRSGLLYAIEGLKELHDEQGVILDPFIEKKFAWELSLNPEPYQENWIGFIHTSPVAPDWWDYSQKPQCMFSLPLWQESVDYCKGIFCLSDWLKDLLQPQFDFPVSSLILPTETPDLKFSMERYIANPNKKVVQVGWWLRKLHSIYYLPVTKIQKAILYLDKPFVNEKFTLEKERFGLKPDYDSVEIIDRLSDEDYDQLLSENIVYMEMYDSCSNNAVVECIVRNTPILINPLPVVVEYLGEDYPFYFESRRQAAKKVEDLSLIEATYNYLKFHPLKEKLKADYFLKSFVESQVYQNLN